MDECARFKGVSAYGWTRSAGAPGRVRSSCTGDQFAIGGGPFDAREVSMHPKHLEQHFGHAHAQSAEHAGHDKHGGHSIAMFRRKFWLSFVLTIPTLVWGHMLQEAFGYPAPHFSGAMWISPVFGTAVFLYGGAVFIQGAIRELRDRLP